MPLKRPLSMNHRMPHTMSSKRSLPSRKAKGWSDSMFCLPQSATGTLVWLSPNVHDVATVETFEVRTPYVVAGFEITRPASPTHLADGSTDGLGRSLSVDSSGQGR